MIGIIGAMQVEVELLVSKMKSVSIDTLGNRDYIKGTIGGQNVVVVQSGIGKVNAGIAATILSSKYSVDNIINIGVAGGIGKDIKVGDIVVATSCVQFDVVVDSTNGGAIGVVDGMQAALMPCDGKLVDEVVTAITQMGLHCRVGTVATSDKFITDWQQLEIVKELFDPQAVEMETGAIAQVCRLFNVPFCAIRTISDTADNKAEIDFATHMNKTAQTSISIVLEWIKNTH